MAQRSVEEQRAVIERFYEQVTEGLLIDETWTKNMIEASTPRLPDRPTPEQLAAWDELAELVTNPAFVAVLRASTKQSADDDIDLEAFRLANMAAADAAAHLRSEGYGPTSDAGRELVMALVDGIALASGRRATEDLKRDVRRRFTEHDPRVRRHWELLGIINGRVMSSRLEDWAFVMEAAQTHLPP